MKNRICVALTRAREGLFIVGNMQLLSACSNSWRLINDEFIRQHAIGDHLPLKCSRHGNVTCIKCSDDFGIMKFGGCGYDCDFSMECGHICSIVCHTEIFDHVCDNCN